MQCELASHAGQSLRLRLPEGQKSLLANFGDKLREALAEKLGGVIQLDVELVADTRASPAAARAREQADRQSEAEAAIQGDPFIQTLARECDATVNNIRPLAGQARLTGTDN
jgi:DNA polymerase-3 subunit gamma/tau